MFTGREFAAQGSQAYYAYTTKHPIRDCEHRSHILRDCPEFRTIGNAMFYLGAQYAIAVSSELSPHIARFLEFTMWLTERNEPLEEAYVPY